MDYQNILLITVAVLTAGLSLSIVHGKKNDANNVFSLFILAIGLWSVLLAFFRFSGDLVVAHLYSRLYYIAAAAIPVFFLHFSYVFPQKKPFGAIQHLFVYGIPTVLALLVLVIPDAVIKSVSLTENGIKDVTINPLGYMVYTLYFVGYLFAAYYKLFASYRSATQKLVRIQLRFIFFGTIVPYLCAMYFNLFLPPFNYEYIWVGPLFATIVIWSVVYAVYKHKLLNVKVVTTEIFTFSLWVFIFARVLLGENIQEKTINTILLFLTIAVGIFLIRSVRKEVEQRERIEKLAGELEKTNAALAAANERLKELDQLKSEFVSLATHQIRGPITAIKGYASMLLQGDFGAVPDACKKPIDTIFKSSASLAGIVQDYLDVSRIEQGRMKYEISDFDLSVLVAEAAAEFKSSIEQKNLTLSLEIEPNIAVRADAGKLKQVIENLIDNALKYTMSGGIEVMVRKPEQKKVRIEVRDTGVGIAPETLPNLFKKFSRASDASRANLKGTGLGLYVARQLLEAQGGSIRAESEGEGKGATFIVELPTT